MKDNINANTDKDSSQLSFGQRQCPAGLRWYGRIESLYDNTFIDLHVSRQLEIVTTAEKETFPQADVQKTGNIIVYKTANSSVCVRQMRRSRRFL